MHNILNMTAQQAMQAAIAHWDIIFTLATEYEDSLVSSAHIFKDKALARVPDYCLDNLGVELTVDVETLSTFSFGNTSEIAHSCFLCQYSMEETEDTDLKYACINCPMRSSWANTLVEDAPSSHCACEDDVSPYAEWTACSGEDIPENTYAVLVQLLYGYKKLYPECNIFGYLYDNHPSLQEDVILLQKELNDDSSD